MEKYYISTAITYTSSKPHIGNTYEIILADAIARFKRSQGYEVYLQTGTDEHGEKIEQKAKKNGLTPKEYVDNLSGQIKDIWDLMNTSYDKFVRTTDPNHEIIVQKIFKKMYDQGDIYKSEYNGLYCVPCESFWTESQLYNGKCPDCGGEVVTKSEEAYFFRLSKYQSWLEKFYEDNPDFIVPASRKNEMINNFIKPGLQDLCVSRSSFSWGIPVSFDNKHVVYVWLDALTNYITFIGYDPEKESVNFNKLWPADLHLVGKDIIRFHVIYWPIFLKSLDLPMPKQVYGHPWVLFDNDKMSKSKGNVLYADDLVHEFGVDRVRYYILSQIPYGNDGSITKESLINVCNTDLSNIYGNLVSRTISMIDKYFGGSISKTKECDQIDNDLISKMNLVKSKYSKLMNDYKVSEAINEVFIVLRKCNKYIDDTMPWILAKDETKKDRLQNVLYNLLNAIRICTILLNNIMPESTDKVLKAIGSNYVNYNEANVDFFEKNININNIDVLFPRIINE